MLKHGTDAIPVGETGEIAAVPALVGACGRNMGSFAPEIALQLDGDPVGISIGHERRLFRDGADFFEADQSADTRRRTADTCRNFLLSLADLT